jgi:photosystem II stability/assembly factor-like uncharacterized protein
MGVNPRRSSPTISRRTKTLFVAGTLVAVAAVPAWRTKSLIAELRAPATAMEQDFGQWRQIGQSLRRSPGAVDPSDPYMSGRVASVAVDPRDATRWLVGVGNGGVWETRDAGRSWTPIGDDAPTLAIGAVTFAPGNPDVIYVGTGEYVGTSPSGHVGVGILKSVNGGQSWALMGQSSFNRTSVRRLRVDPNDANVVVAASAYGGSGREGGPPNAALALPQFGVRRSTDGGATWVRALAGQASALEVDPTNFSRQYAAIFNQNPNVIDPGNVSNGIYRSRNGGVTWSRIEGPWGPEPSVPRQSAVGRIELAIAPSDPNVLYASIQLPISAPTDIGGLLGLYRTDNAWADQPTWIQIPAQATGSDGYCGGCGNNHVISVDPRAADTLYAGGRLDLWRCTRCGVSPTWTATRRTHADFHVLAWAGNRLITGNDGGLFSSTDLSANWQSHNQPLTTSMFIQGALHPTDPEFLLAGLRDYRPVTYRASTGWRELPLAATASWGHSEVAISSSRPNTDWMGTHLSAVIQRTTDGGRTTLQVDGDIDKTNAATVAPVRKCPANDDVFLAGTNRIWRTNDFFNSAMPSWTVNSRPAETQSILTITFVESDRNCNTYAYSTRAGVVRMTKDGGTTWSDLDPMKTLPERPVNSIAFDPTNSNRAFVAVSFYDVGTPTKPGHIFRTDNALSSSPTWTRVGPPDQPFADMPFNIIKIDPRDTQLVYAGSDNGLWQSTDGGTNWTKLGLGQGLPPASVFDIQINPTTNKTVIFTYGRGAYELAR